MLYVTLLHQQMRHPGAPRFSSSSVASTPSAMAVPEADITGITLALQTLGSFNFGGQCSMLASGVCVFSMLWDNLIGEEYMYMYHIYIQLSHKYMCI